MQDSTTLQEHIPDALHNHATQHAPARRLGQDEILFQQGDLSTSCYLVLDGEVEIFIESIGGKHLTLNTLGAGEFFGELALLDHQPRSASVRARKPSRVAVINEKTMHDLMARDEPTRTWLLRLLCKRMRWMNEQSEWAGVRDVPAMIAARLLSLGSDSGQGHNRVIEISQQNLADNVGVTREYVSKVLGRWSRQGWIVKRRGAIEVRDQDRLRDAVGH